MSVRVLQGDARAMLATLPDESVHCCVSSPPYWGLRDYGHPDQMGLESTPEDTTKALADAFACAIVASVNLHLTAKACGSPVIACHGAAAMAAQNILKDLEMPR